MTVLDWAIVAFTIALALWGYRQGLIVGTLTLLGFAAGAFAGSRLGPVLLNQGSESPYAPLCAALGALLAGALMAVTLESLALGLRSRLIRGRSLHLADGAGGAALIASVALGLAWVFGAVALHAPGTRAAARRRAALADPAQPQRGAAAVRADPQRARPGRSGALDRRAGDAGRGARPGDRRRPRRGRAPAARWCGSSAPPAGSASRARAGSPRPGLVVTNAHVVAGEDDTTVTTQDGASLDADAGPLRPRKRPRRCSSVDADLPALPLAADPEVGHRRGGARLSRERPLRRRAGPARRDPRHGQRGLLRQRPDLAPDRLAARRRPQRQLRRPAGRRRAVASSAPSSPRPPPVTPGGFAVPDEVVAEALRSGTAPVDTGPCAV